MEILHESFLCRYFKIQIFNLKIVTEQGPKYGSSIMGRKSGFRLSKWYLDCVNENGLVFIGYAAKLWWKGLSVPYNSKLISLPDGSVSREARFKNLSDPDYDDDEIRWRDSKLKLNGIWKRVRAPLYARLFDSEDGYLDWYCYHPVSQVEIFLEDYNHIKGFGYSEQLVITVEPWKIPMDQLRWGRYISQNDSLVWVGINAESPKVWVWLNGKQMEDAQISDDLITVPVEGIELQMDRGRILENEKKILQIVKAILLWLPGFNKVMTKSFLNADEIKWLSKGKLKKYGKRISNGWVIHELVDFTNKG